MLNFLDSWDRSQKLCWIDSCKAKIAELEKQMVECEKLQYHALYFKLYNRLDQEIETLESLVKEVSPSLTKALN